MREIKFRVWDNHQQCWVRESGAVYLSPNINGIYISHIKMGKHFVVMQYTGLKDKNGTKIYEGDIVRHHMHKISDNEPISTDSVVRWETNIGYDEPGVGYQLNPDDMDQCEVVGNIYENPELLTPENK